MKERLRVNGAYQFAHQVPKYPAVTDPTKPRITYVSVERESTDKPTASAVGS